MFEAEEFWPQRPALRLVKLDATNVINTLTHLPTPCKDDADGSVSYRSLECALPAQCKASIVAKIMNDSGSVVIEGLFRRLCQILAGHSRSLGLSFILRQMFTLSRVCCVYGFRYRGRSLADDSEQGSSI